MSSSFSGGSPSYSRDPAPDLPSAEEEILQQVGTVPDPVHPEEEVPGPVAHGLRHLEDQNEPKY